MQDVDTVDLARRCVAAIGEDVARRVDHQSDWFGARPIVIVSMNRLPDADDDRDVAQSNTGPPVISDGKIPK